MAGATVTVDWPAELQQQVARLAREHNATSFMVVQAALVALLAKISASTDVAVGFPIAGRRDPALDDLVGFFVNTLVLRADVAEDPTFADLLTRSERAVWRPSSTRTCRSRCSSSGSTRREAWPTTRWCRCMLAWQNFTGLSDPAAGSGLKGAGRHARFRSAPSPPAWT